MTNKLKRLVTGTTLSAVTALAACQGVDRTALGNKRQAMMTAATPTCVDDLGNTAPGCTSDDGAAPSYYQNDEAVAHNCPDGSAYTAQNRDCATVPTTTEWDPAISADTQRQIASALDGYLAGLVARDVDAMAAQMDEAAIDAAVRQGAATDGVDLVGYGPLETKAVVRSAAASIIASLPSETPTTFVRRVVVTARGDVFSAVLGWTANVGFIRDQYDHFSQPGMWVDGATSPDSPDGYATSELRMEQQQVAVVLGTDGVARIATVSVLDAAIELDGAEGSVSEANVLAGRPPPKTPAVWAAEYARAFGGQLAPTEDTVAPSAQ